MNDSKSWYQSKAVWGGIIVLVSTILQIAGVASVSAEEQATIVDSVVSLALVVSQLAGSLLAIYGRVKANQVVR